MLLRRHDNRMENIKPKYEDMTLDALKSAAKEKGIKGYAVMKKETLIERLGD